MPSINQAQFTSQNKSHGDQRIRSNKPLNIEQTIESLRKQQDGFLKLTLAEIQSPKIDALFGEGGSSGNSQNQMLTLSQSMLDVSATEAELKMAQETLESNKQSQLYSTINKEIAYDHSIMKYDGTATKVDFEYKVSGISGAIGAKAIAKVRIFDQNNHIVFDGTTECINGVNKFTWDCKNNKGIKVEPDKYKISITGFTNIYGAPCAATTNFNSTGIVRAISIADSGMISLVLHNGTQVQADQIREITDAKEANNILEANDYLNHIGKTAAVDLSKIRVSNSKTEILYDNIIQNSDNTRIEIFDSKDKQVANIAYKQKLAYGFNSMTLDLQEFNCDIVDGEYFCKIFVQNKEDEHESVANIELPVHDSIAISGIDLNANKIIGSNNHKYLPWNISTVGDVASNSTASLIDKGAVYIGKRVEFPGKFIYEGGDFSVDARIPRLDANYISSIDLLIYDGNTLISTNTTTAANLYDQNVEIIPRYDQLDAGSKINVDQYVKDTKLLNGINTYTQLTQEQQITIAPYIAQQFRAGNLFKQGQTHDISTKLKNMGVVQLKWNGVSDTGATALQGKEYLYKVVTHYADNNTKELTSMPLTTSIVSTVNATEVTDGQLFLILENNMRITSDEILAVRA